MHSFIQIYSSALTDTHTHILIYRDAPYYAMYGASENDGVIALVCVLDTYYLGGGEMEEHIIIRMLKLRFTKYISLDNNDIRLYSFD